MKPLRLTKTKKGENETTSADGKKMIKKTTRKMPILKLKMLMGKQRIINRVRLTIKQIILETKRQM